LGYRCEAKGIKQESYQNSYMGAWGPHTINMHYKYTKNKGWRDISGKRFPAD